MVDSKLVDGKIPAHSICPFKNDCIWARKPNNCVHEGIKHNVAFSCGLARAFDLTQRIANMQRKENQHECTN